MGSGIRGGLRKVAALLLLLASASGAAETPLERMARILERLGAEGEFSGAVVVMRDGEEILAMGTGLADRAACRPFTPDTPSDTGSIAKSVTGTLVLQQVAEGRLRLDDPVVRWLPAFPHRATTVGHLLGHRAGLPDYDAFEDLYTPGPLTNAKLLAALPDRQPEPAFAPGSRFRYCNLCLDFLADVVAEAGGTPFSTQAIEGLLWSLGATGTFVRPANFTDWPVPRTIGYRGTELFDAFDRESTVGASNIVFSARDLALWADAWARNRAVDPAVLSAAVAGTGPGITPGQWYCDEGRSSCYYTGHHQGFDAIAWWDRGERLAIAFVANGGTSPWLTHRLPRMLRDTADGRMPALPPEPEACRGKADPAALAGRWQLPDGSAALLWLEGGTPWLALPRAPAVELFPVGEGRWYGPGVDTHVCADADRLYLYSIHRDQEAVRDTSAAR